MNISRARFASVLVLLAAADGPLLSQARDPRAPTPATASTFAILGTGWGALAAGRTDDAVKAAERVLTRQPADHAALELKIEALATSQPLPALDAYEAALSRTRIEDVFLLVPVARGTLRQIGAGDDPVLQAEALQRLAAAGDEVAAAQLRDVSESARGTVDVQLALAGNAAAAQRLLQHNVPVPAPTMARALAAGGSAAVPTLRSMLKHRDAPVRMAAAMSLGKMGAQDAAPDLKALLTGPETRSFAAVALTRLGEPDGEAIVQELMQSPSFDVRILGAEAYVGKGPGAWSQALMPALQDPNGLTRIRAAELLAPVAPEAARAVLMDAANDPNPVIRGDVSRVPEPPGLVRPTEPGTPEAADSMPVSKAVAALRRLLRDADPSVRLHAGGSILAVARGR